MKIAICGSMAFAKDMLAAQEKLQSLGHDVELPANTKQYAEGEARSEDKWDKLEQDVIANYYQIIKGVDAILVINKTKSEIDNYVGGNGLIEMAFAHVLGKVIYLLNPIPNMNYTDEIKVMQPVVLEGDLGKLKD